MNTTATAEARVRLGLRENLAQFSLLVGVNALVGGMMGQERTVLPLLAQDGFGLTKFTAALTFIAAFGIVKAGTNFFAGTLSDRDGRKPVLVAGCLVGLPVRCCRGLGEHALTAASGVVPGAAGHRRGVVRA